jgi:DNA-binding GntR family transcriptional regulator
MGARAEAETGVLSAQPLYLNLARSLREKIASGSLALGDRLPGERDLCRRFDISRVTVRRALSELRDQGLIEPAGPRGWFVTARSIGEPNVLMSFSEMARGRGLVPSSQVLAAVTRPATIDEAEDLVLAPGAPIFELRRLRLLDQIPVGIEQTRIPLAVAPSLPTMDFGVDSLYEALRALAVIPTRADYDVQALAAEADQAGPLGLAEGAPLLLARALTYDQSGRPIEMSRSYFRGDRYRFRTTLYSAWLGPARRARALDREEAWTTRPTA